MKNDISYKENSHTDDASHEFYTGAIVPVDTIDVSLINDSNESTEQTDEQESVIFTSEPEIKGPEGFVGEGNDVLPWPTTTAQIDAYENVNYALGLIIPDGSDKTPAPTNEQGNVGIVPISANVPMTTLETGGSGLYIDNPETGLRSQLLLHTDISDLATPTVIATNDITPAQNKNPTSGNDVLTGKASNDKLLGLAGNDTLDGVLGDDTLDGGVGNDVLTGGDGKDKLIGGAGADTFKFTSSTDSTLWNMDTITDFKHAQGDKIDLSAIDSNANLAGDQSFKLVNAFNTADSTGQLYFDAKTHILYGSTDADSAPEFAITLNGVSTLVAADFIF